MKTLKLLKGIAGKLKNRKGSQITNTPEGSAIEEPRTSDTRADVEIKEQEETINVNKATETDTQLYEDIDINVQDLKTLQPICESREEAKNTSVDNAMQEPNAHERRFSAKSCFDSEENSAGKKLSTKAIQQKRAILAGSAGIVLLVGSVVSYIMKMHVIAVIGGIIGLACIGFALYNLLKLNTKIEKIEGVEHPIVQSVLSPA
ncbi:hypothetical protein [Wolbachia endosymbiont (group A) of Myopa testacea]|uniref:hypothetical protein n=1 Tax=Wolbachia endosymbiont (group A) of Myopa testacea TaxID=3066148 RepID=UPI0033417B37